jgi:hypothetical protein
MSTPAASCAGNVRSPPGFGKRSSAAALNVVVVLGLRVLSTGGSAETLTDDVRPAIGSVSRTVSTRPNATVTDCWTCSNAGASASTR